MRVRSPVETLRVTAIAQVAAGQRLQRSVAGRVADAQAALAVLDGQVRLALQVEDSAATSEQLQQAGATHIAGPVVTPWRHSNVRLEAPDGMQLTLFTVLDA